MLGTTRKKIKGRGEGTGKGKTAGRGQKGYHAKHSTTGPYRGFEGGQSGLISAIPKLGNRGLPKPRLTRLYLDTLQHFIDTGKLDTSKTITIRELVEAGAVGKIKDGVVLLGKGGEFFTHKIDLEVTRASQPAIKVVEQRGGKVAAVFHGKTALKAMLNPSKWAIMPQNPIPTAAHAMARYTDPVRRGSLAPVVEGVEKSAVVSKLLAMAAAKRAAAAAASGQSTTARPSA
ncbi:ribosomal protein L18e/L15P [Fimicolochytrium jonesii]|uniref:ribosomal protein L18e/L15P n=1 Tax=Fimicolochytrium jonesii TaxID=1396493 RepID=UPI0022FE86A3|nr:ribosomal protein L18e/L15P [Fimicolochytrium jonesii]KAI8823176.1 ribosomal protein L18e/L15P [Fimicolochytrium jonesii]